MLSIRLPRPEMVVGWYHSHPGFGCWLSGVDVNTQQSFEALNQRAVAGELKPQPLRWLHNAPLCVQ